MMLSRIAWLLAVSLLPMPALAQDAPAAGNGAPADPVAALAGVWQVDKVESDYETANTLIDRTVKIDRDSVASLTGGTCSQPGFALDPATGGIAVTCLGQVLATAALDPAAPDTLHWAEPNVQAELHRIAGAPEAAGKDAGGDSQGDSGGDSGGGSGGDSGDASGEGDAQ